MPRAGTHPLRSYGPNGLAKLVATNVEGVLVKGSGHWLVDEAPGQVLPRLVTFFK